MGKQVLKNAIDLLIGKTATVLNEKFILVAGSAEPGYAKLIFKDDGLRYRGKVNERVGVETPYNGALIQDGTDLENLGLPRQVLKNFELAKKAKEEVELLGVTDTVIGYNNAALGCRNGGPVERIHEIFIAFPIDDKHRRNRLVAKSMSKHDREGVNYYRPKQAGTRTRQR